MFVSYKWLQEFVDLTGETPKDLAEKITRSGIEVESVTVAGLEIEKVVVGHVLSREQHPDADRLSVCQVDIGTSEPVQIVCGAPNVGAGQYVPVALAGAVLPGGIKIKKGSIRGQESNGMICSLGELGVDSKLTSKDFATGIFQFPTSMEIGIDAIKALYLDDAILELGLTPNRSDCLSMIGVAYEVAAILSKEVKVRPIEYTASAEKASDYVSVKIETENNLFYVAKIVKNVKVGPSPLWLQACLMASGVRPQNNVVDITNFILMEYGQPLHAFDYDRLGSKEIVVRQANVDEKIVTLDEVERTLTPEQMVITNGEKPVAIAGVMGGFDSSVTEETTTIIIESAYFNGQSIRKTSRELGLRSESSARFEKNVDPNRVKAAAERAAQLLSQFASGEVAEGTVEAGSLVIPETAVTVTKTKINRVLGTTLTCKEIHDILTRLQFTCTCDGETIQVQVPSRRGDITIAEDIIEEVGRIYGYDNIPTTLPTANTNEKGLTEHQLKRRKVRNYLEAAGLSEVVTYSLTSNEKAQKFALATTEKITLAMPMSEERNVLRQSLIPSLIDVLKYNQARQMENIAMYEIGSVFLQNESEQLPNEYEKLSGAITGTWHAHAWQGEKKAVDFYVAKGILEGLFAKLRLNKMIVWKQAQLDGLHPGRTAEITLQNGESIGFVGQLHPLIQKENDLKETYVFEIALHKLLEIAMRPVKFSEIPRFPSVTRDIALVVDQKLNAGEIQKVIEKAGGRILKEISIFDVYQGSHVDEGQKSMAFSLKYFDASKTLTDEEVTAAHEKVLQQVKEKLGAVLRG